MLIAIKTGEEKRDAFVDVCRKKPERFEQHLKRVTIHNFASENLLKKSKSKQVKELVNVRGTRDMSGDFLFGSEKKNRFKNSVSLSSSTRATLFCSP